MSQWNKIDKLKAQQERKWAPLIKRVLQSMVMPVYTKPASYQAAQIEASKITDTELKPLYQKLYTQSGAAFGKMQFDLLGSELVAGAEEALVFEMSNYLRDKAGYRITHVTKDTITRVQSALVEFEQSGFLIQDALNQMRDEAIGFEPWRANMIARTEIAAASSHARYIAAKSTGLPLLKEWVATTDSRTRPSHRSADGQRVPIDANFNVGGVSIFSPGAAGAPADEVINCRCADVYIVQQELQ